MSTPRAFTAWLAVFALFIQMLAPLQAAWASDANPDVTYQVICTANGVQTIAIGEDGAPIDRTDTTSCPLCVVHAIADINVYEGAVFSALVPPAPLTFAQPHSYILTNIWQGAPRPSRAPPLFV